MGGTCWEGGTEGGRKRRKIKTVRFCGGVIRGAFDGSRPKRWWGQHVGNYRRALGAGGRALKQREEGVGGRGRRQARPAATESLKRGCRCCCRTSAARSCAPPWRSSFAFCKNGPSACRTPWSPPSPCAPSQPPSLPLPRPRGLLACPSFCFVVPSKIVRCDLQVTGHIASFSASEKKGSSSLLEMYPALCICFFFFSDKE